MKSSHMLNINGELKVLDQALIMGIINITPDSFYSKSSTSGTDQALERAEQMLIEGADILDIGGYSSRPGAKNVPESEELARVIPIIKAIQTKFPKSIISIDTFRSTVAKAAVESGAQLINDISGGMADPNMFKTVKDLTVPYILMHMAGNPKTMQVNPSYENVLIDVYRSLSARVNDLRKLGVQDIIIDPGFGFGKTIEHNYTLLRQLDYFHSLNCPVLVGVSRKSMVYKPLGISPEEALNGTSVLHALALFKGAQILRVHDVEEAKQAVKLYSLMNRE